ncbi:LOW QUALITY PROTEIN: hypothetical protein MAR_038022 [Mya arenaria]|uniref:Uncharacterized protein n=1 Tax=Mya arenaria TaxID=6604 RepID=A0ABY7FU47_MYAAR|nr:LOW QUALITY PROTEIN: hypothetical protein MAR_038022 [Mya arenaria]
MDASCKKRVSWLSEDGIVSKLAVVEYVGKFPDLAAHDNSRIPNSEFVRTPAHVIQEMSNELASNQPSDVFSKLANKFDEVTRPSSIQQVKDRKRQMSKASNTNQGPSLNVADQTIHLKNMVTHNHPFVRFVIHSSKSPSIRLYTDKQLQDLRNFCCYGQTVLSIDKTFNFCDMHVTVTCFKQLSVDQLHQMSIQSSLALCSFMTTATLHRIANSLTTSRSSWTVTSIGSDDKRSLVKTIKRCFPNSEHILWYGQTQTRNNWTTLLLHERGARLLKRFLGKYCKRQKEYASAP